jgi:hypothetical protein
VHDGKVAMSAAAAKMRAAATPREALWESSRGKDAMRAS